MWAFTALLSTYSPQVYIIFFPTLQGSWEKKLIERIHNVRSSSGRKMGLAHSTKTFLSQAVREVVPKPHRTQVVHTCYPHIEVLENNEALINELSGSWTKSCSKTISGRRLLFHFYGRRSLQEGNTCSKRMISHSLLFLKLTLCQPYAISEGHS